MSLEKNKMASPPRFSRSLVEIPLFKVSEWTSLGKRRGLRKRASQNFFGLTSSHLSSKSDYQDLRRGRDRSLKQRSNGS